MTAVYERVVTTVSAVILADWVTGIKLEWSQSGKGTSTLLVPGRKSLLVAFGVCTYNFRVS